MIDVIEVVSDSSVPPGPVALCVALPDPFLPKTLRAILISCIKSG